MKTTERERDKKVSELKRVIQERKCFGCRYYKLKTLE